MRVSCSQGTDLPLLPSVHFYTVFTRIGYQANTQEAFLAPSFRSDSWLKISEFFSMSGPESGPDISTKYQKLATEYAKLR